MSLPPREFPPDSYNPRQAAVAQGGGDRRTARDMTEPREIIALSLHPGGMWGPTPSKDACGCYGRADAAIRDLAAAGFFLCTEGRAVIDGEVVRLEQPVMVTPDSDDLAVLVNGRYVCPEAMAYEYAPTSIEPLYRVVREGEQ